MGTEWLPSVGYDQRTLDGVGKGLSIGCLPCLAARSEVSSGDRVVHGEILEQALPRERRKVRQA